MGNFLGGYFVGGAVVSLLGTVVVYAVGKQELNKQTKLTEEAKKGAKS